MSANTDVPMFVLWCTGGFWCLFLSPAVAWTDVQEVWSWGGKVDLIPNCVCVCLEGSYAEQVKVDTWKMCHERMKPLLRYARASLASVVQGEISSRWLRDMWQAVVKLSRGFRDGCKMEHKSEDSWGRRVANKRIRSHCFFTPFRWENVLLPFHVAVTWAAFAC